MPGWNEFAAFIEKAQEVRRSLDLRPHQECFFRGHRDTAYKLTPSLLRQGPKTSEEYWQLERRTFFEFRSRARQLYDADRSDWDVLFPMQHHGVPTRLLDWTSVFGVALSFALLDYDDASEQNPCVWILNPYALNHATWGLYRLYDPKYLARDEGANRSYGYSELLLGTHPKEWGERRLWDTPLAIYAPQWSERMFAQSGWFTIHGTDLRAIEDLWVDRPGILQKVDVPRSAIPGAREFLSLAGINHRLMFPDLDGLARSVCEKFAMKR